MKYDVALEQSDKVIDRFKNKITKPHVFLEVIFSMAGYQPESQPVDRAQVEGMGEHSTCVSGRSWRWILFSLKLSLPW